MQSDVMQEIWRLTMQPVALKTVLITAVWADWMSLKKMPQSWTFYSWAELWDPFMRNKKIPS